MKQQDDLEARVESRKRELITEIIEHKKNSSRSGAAEAVERLRQHLSELPQILKAGKWSNLGEGTRLRLIQWMAK